MSNAITTKYRPVSFSDVIGQSCVSLIQSKIKNRKAPNALLFHGIRGTGKTTVARLVAMSLNCERSNKDGDPCLECESCLAALRDVNPNIKELDMASNRGIEEVRDLQRILQYAPVNNGFRVIILDEAHQITSQGSSALLKTLENPPINTLFILCTTDPQKLLATIRSRCEKHSFLRVKETDIIKRLEKLCQLEGVEYEEEALQIIAKSSAGSVRDAESLLGAHLVSDKLLASSVQQLLNIESDFDRLLEFITKNDQVSLLRFFKDNADKITEESWLVLFVEFLINKAINENSLTYSSLVAKMSDGIKYFGSSLPPAFIQLIFLNLASQFEVKMMSRPVNWVYALADWFSANEFRMEEGFVLYFVDPIWIAVYRDQISKDNLRSYEIAACIEESKVQKILDLDPGVVDKNELIEMDLLELVN